MQLKLNVKGTLLKTNIPYKITSSMVNFDTCIFDFDKSWNGYTKTAVFYSDSTNKIDILLDNDSCVIPWENLINDGVLYIGVYGVKNGSIVPTNFVNIQIDKGAYRGNSIPTEHTLDVNAQVVQKIGEFSLAETARIQAENVRKQTAIDFNKDELARKTAEQLRVTSFEKIKTDNVNHITEIDTDYNSLKTIMIDKNNAANLQNQVNGVKSELQQIALNVKMFGAKGNGIADDTTAIQNGINYAIENGRKLYCPTGKYRVTRTLYIDDKIELYGSGQDTQFVVYSNFLSTMETNPNILAMSGAYSAVFAVNKNTSKEYEGLSDQLDGVSLHDFKIVGDRRNHFAHGLLLQGVDHCRFYNISIEELKGSAIIMAGIRENFFDNINVRFCALMHNYGEDELRKGYPTINMVLNPIGGDQNNFNTFSNCQIMCSYYTALRMNGSFNNNFVNCNFHQLHPNMAPYMGVEIEGYPVINGRTMNFHIIQLLDDTPTSINKLFDRFTNCIAVWAGEYKGIIYVENHTISCVQCDLGYHWYETATDNRAYYCIEAYNAVVYLSNDCYTYVNSSVLLDKGNTIYRTPILDTAIKMHACTCVYTTANTVQNFYFTIPSNLLSLQPVASIKSQTTTSEYEVKMIFCQIDNGKLRIGLKSSVAQTYTINVIFKAITSTLVAD